jgi:hypothetical protein
VWARIAADVAREEALAVAEPDDERHVLAGADQRSPSPRCITAIA